MYSQNPKYRKQLNSSQLAVLELLYKFRFGTRDLIASYLNKKDIYRQLRILEDQRLIEKHYESTYRLLGKPAIYYLLPEGVRKLDALSVASRKPVMKPIYKLKTLSEQFMRHSVDILAIRNVMYQQDEMIKFFTKADLAYADYDYFPQPLPDAYIRLPNGQQYFMHIHQSYQPFFVASQTVTRYADYFEDGEWGDTGTDFPVLLFIVDSRSVQDRLRKLIRKQGSDMRVYIAIKIDVLNSTDGCVWRDIDESDTVYTLDQLKSSEAI